MSTTIRLITGYLLCAIIYLTSAYDATAANDRRDQSSRTRTSQQTGKTSDRNNRRPSARPSNNSQNSTSGRPGANIRPNRPNKPDSPKPNRPGSNIRPERPGHNGTNVRPNKPDRPGSMAPSHMRPNRPARPQRPPHAGLPSRPHMPSARPLHHPVPPPSWHPRGRYPVLSTVLGISFGSAIGFTVNTLIAEGYNVAGYGNDMVYLTNVPQLNLNWPDATLYYNSGGLTASQFVYSTSYSDMSRYNLAYNRLVNLYGMPVDYTNTAGQLSATWFGRNGQFVSLSFAPQYSAAGALGYYTTLSFGN